MTAAVQRATAGFARRAEDEDLVDVAYASIDSPFGPMLTAVTDHGLVTVVIDGDDEAHLDRIARDISPRILESPARLDGVRRQLDEYFAGRRRAFEIDWDIRALPAYNRRVLEELARVEYGRTTTYGALAARTGNPRAARAVGTIMNRNPIPIVLPCHRVVGANGSLVGYAGGLERKQQLLKLEGAVLA